MVDLVQVALFFSLGVLAFFIFALLSAERKLEHAERTITLLQMDRDGWKKLAESWRNEESLPEEIESIVRDGKVEEE